jgi:hypothetical protein
MTDLHLTSPTRFRIGVVFGWVSVATFVAVCAGLSALLAGELPVNPAWPATMLVAGLAAAVMTGRGVSQMRDIRATPAGLRVSRGGGRGEVVVPWTRVRRMRRSFARSATAWVVDYEEGGGRTVRVRTLYWAEPDESGWETPRQVERVHALWSHAAGPVTLRQTTWASFELVRDGENVRLKSTP